MKLKRHTDFINENSDYQDLVLKAEKALEEAGFVKVKDRFNYSGDSMMIDHPLKSKIIYKQNLLVSFGVINTDFRLNAQLKNESIKNLPTKVNGYLDLSNNHFSDLKDFHTIFTSFLNISHNHLNKLQNIPKEINGIFDCSFNMLTSLVGCPEKVYTFKASENWLRSNYGAPNLVENDGKNNIILDQKIPQIERDFYQSNCTKGIINYWTELFQYIFEIYKNDVVKRDEFITQINWPKDTDFDNMKKSVQTISKFGL